MFLQLDGSDGAGKTTAARLLAERLAKEFPSIPVHSLREPGSGSLGPLSREALLRADGPPLANEAELFLFLASRAQVMRECVIPALQKQEIVILDRSTLSTLAYQVSGRGLPMHLAVPAIELATCEVVPDTTFLLTVSLGRAQARMREKSPDRIESAGDAFHHRVSDGYEQFASLLSHRASNPWHIYAIDTDDLSAMQVHERMYRHLGASGMIEKLRVRGRADHGVVG